MLNGYKTYIIAAIAAVVGVDQGLIQFGYHVPAIPGYVLFFLTAAGLYSARSGTTNDVAKATTDILGTIGTINLGPAGTPATVTTPAAPSDDPTFTSGPKMAGK